MKSSTKDRLNNPKFPEIITIETPQDRGTAINSENEPFIRYLNSIERIVILSSHLDDAVLSMGSLIDYLVKNKRNIEIISVFTEGSSVSSPSVQRILGRDNFTDINEYFIQRRTEDMNALLELNIQHTKHLGFIDAAWRVQENGTPLYPDYQLVPLLPQDKILHKKLVMKLKEIIEYTSKVAVFAPLAMGNHVDHQIVRNAAAEAFANAIFYQDFPYSAIHANEDAFVIQKKLSVIEWKGDYSAKKNAILKYKTQLKSFTLFFKGPVKVSHEMYYVPSSLI